MKPEILIMRGNTVCDWDLRPIVGLKDRFDIRVLVPSRNLFDTTDIDLDQHRIRTRDAIVPFALPHRIAAQHPRNRAFALGEHFEWAEVVHAAELSNWYTAQAAQAKRKYGFKLVVSTWETLPHRRTYRSKAAARNRLAVIEHADLFIPWTDRARDCLILEGVEPERIVVTRAGVDTANFAAARSDERGRARPTIISPGRMVWGKGHLDVMRAIAALMRGIVELPPGAELPRAIFIGGGREVKAMSNYAEDLGIADHVEFRASVPYPEMPNEFARASMMVLASLPNQEWEEQFGFVLVEAMASGLPIAASSSGAIPEVVDGAAELFSPGDWIGLAEIFARAAELREDDSLAAARQRQLQLYSLDAAAARYASAYRRVFGSG